jgi:hypothetical protein
MNICVDANKQKIVEKFISEHPEMFILKNKKSGSFALGKYLGNVNRNNVLVMFDTEQPTHFAFCFDNNDDIIEVYNVSIGEVKVY